ncbi:MAG: site-2 protease family protein [Clostridia bacterium]|nr:site-2 protease family protein [Clostridia bacterium]
MLLSLIRNGASLSEWLTRLLLSLPVILLALTVHEVSHGWVAMKLGDPTARNLGRLTLNPLKHLDPIGTVCMVLFGFGWARPVPINVRYFKKPRRDMALTALAGPASNFIMGFFGVLFYRILIAVFNSVIGPTTSEFAFNVANVIVTLFYLFAWLNLSLGLFNLIPIPPLDGSRIFLTFLPPKYYFGVMKYERYIMLAFMILLYTGIVTTPLGWLVGRIFSGMNYLVGLIPGL